MSDKNLQRIYEKFDHDVLQMIIYAKAANVNAEVDCLYPESFIVGILTTGDNSVNAILLQQDVDLHKCLKTFKTKLAERKNKKQTEEMVSYENLKKSKQVVEIILDSEKISEGLSNDNGSFINLQHIFLAIMHICPDIKKIFEEEGLKHNQFIEDVKKSKAKKNGKKKEPEAAKTNSAFDSFCVNMTEMASQNKYDPIISRDNEIESAITVLCRRNKSNPILVGEPGVGKTAIVEGICQRIVSNTVPKKLRGCKIFSLNVGALVAGTKYRGEFENRLQTLIKNLLDDPSAILFIDEIHNIIGAGSASGSVDAANMLKPALARDLKCIGATTNSEYKKYFSGEGALERRFEKIDVGEPSKEQVKKILIGIKPKLEDFHKCVISDESIDMAIELTGRYLPVKHFPDKAIDCIDTACAKYAWKEDSKKYSISSADIAEVVSKQCQVPLEIIMWDNQERIKNTELSLYSRVIGEDHAVKSVCRTLRNAYSGVRNPNKPIGIFVFGGQSGTGKTHLAKEVAKALFNNEASFIRIDMTEFSEAHSVSKITGSPPGYVGFNEVDVIADKIRRKPYCVLLLDEIEKSHPDVMKLFLQVMADGAFTDSVGNKVNCKNIILIMTGNFGMNDKGKATIGFAEASGKSQVEKEQQRLITYCKESYGVEFVNRVDEFIPFIPLTDEALLKIIQMQLDDFSKHVAQNSCKVFFLPSVPQRILELIKDEHGLNATIVSRLISKKIEPCIADAILSLTEAEKSQGTNVVVDIKDKEFITKINKRKINK